MTTHRAGWRPDVQGLRAVAIALVVAYHAGLPVPGGFAGVDLFFVISGYVIAGMLARERAATGRIRYRRFYGRRAIRLLPASALAVTATLVGSALLEAPFGAQQLTATTGEGGSVLAANLVLLTQRQGYFDRLSRINPLVHLWSLGVEEQFYLLVPAAAVLCALVASRARGRAGALRGVGAGWVVGASFIVSLGLFLLTSHGWVPGRYDAAQVAFFSLPTRGWELAAGVLAARWRWPAPRGTGLVGALLLVAAALTPGPTAASLLAVGGGVALVARQRAGSRLSRALSARPMVGVGNLSYSWYLWHWPVVVYAGLLFPAHPAALPVAAAASLAPAYAAGRWVENPLRRGFPRRARPVALLALGCVAVPFVAGVGLAAGSRAGWGRPALRTLVADSALTTLGRRLDCLATGPLQAPPARCTRTVPGAHGAIVLAGDSHADSLSDGVVAAGNLLGYDVALRAGRACPLTSVGRLTTSQIPRCADYGAQVLREIELRRPALVVLAHSSWEYQQELAGRGDPDPAGRWAASLAATARRLAATGIHVLVVQDIPRLGLRPAPCRYGALLPLRCATPLAEVLSRQGQVAAAETAALAGIPGLLRVDPTAALCDGDRCDAVRGGRLLYADNQHLNSNGSLSLVPRLAGWIQACLAVPFAPRPTGG